MADIIEFPIQKLPSGTGSGGAHADAEQARMEAIRDLLGAVLGDLITIKCDLVEQSPASDHLSIQ